MTKRILALFGELAAADTPSVYDPRDGSANPSIVQVS
jgi:hypothetical protein